MKGQDILLLLKIFSIECQLKNPTYHKQEALKAHEPQKNRLTDFSVRALSHATGIGKSEVSQSLKRCLNVRLAKLEPHTKMPHINTKDLQEFIVYGLRYVFPPELGPITRGIATSFAAPILQGKLLTAGDNVYVWPDAYGKTKGQAIKPLYPSVPYAVTQDPLLYALLALVDAIRMGQARERHLASDELAKLLRINHE